MTLNYDSAYVVGAINAPNIFEDFSDHGKLSKLLELFLSQASDWWQHTLFDSVIVVPLVSTPHSFKVHHHLTTLFLNFECPHQFLRSLSQLQTHPIEPLHIHSMGHTTRQHQPYFWTLPFLPLAHSTQGLHNGDVMIWTGGDVRGCPWGPFTVTNHPLYSWSPANIHKALQTSTQPCKHPQSTSKLLRSASDLRLW